MKSKLFIVITLFALFSCSKSKQDVKNLETFTKIYGYVRYFHPSDEATKIDWDKFAIYGCKEVEKCKNSEELVKILDALFKPVAPSIIIYKTADNVTFDTLSISPGKSDNLKPVCWQYIGLNPGTVYTAYQSARTNRPIRTKFYMPKFFSSGDFNATIDISKYAGKEFVYSVKAKRESKYGESSLWTCFLSKDGNPCSRFTNSDSIIIDKNWKTYEMKGTLQADAAKLVAGIGLREYGIFYFDDIEVKVKSTAGWETIYFDSFEKDDDNLKPSGINLGMGIGPMGTEGYELVTKNIGNNKCIRFQSGNFAEVSEMPSQSLFKEQPKDNEVLKKDIGSGVSCYIPLKVYGDSLQTFPADSEKFLMALQDKLNVIDLAQASGDDLYVRLADVVILWNAIQHFFPYFEYLDVNWESQLVPALQKAYEVNSAFDFHLELSKMLTPLKDGHAQVTMPDNIGENYFLPLKWEWIENQLVVTKIFDDKISIHKGYIVKSINGQQAKEYFDEIRTYTPSSSEGNFLYKSSICALWGFKNSIVNLEYHDSTNTPKKIELKKDIERRKFERMFVDWDNNPIRKLEDNIWYVNATAIDLELFQQFLPDLTKAKGIIIDFRGYPRTGEWLGYFLNMKDTTTRQFQTPQIIYPDQAKPTKYNYSGGFEEPIQPHIGAKLVVLINANAWSWSESILTTIEHYKLATFVGQPTGGINGNANGINLPGGYEAVFTGMKVVRQDGTKFFGIGVKPNVLVDRTIKGFRENRDEILEKGIDVLKEQIK